MSAATVTAAPAMLGLVAPLPGLPGHDTLQVTPLDDSGVVLELRGAGEQDRPLRLFAAVPSVFFPDYAPGLPADALRQLGLQGASEAMLLALIHPADDAHEVPTMNLVAPLVVDPRSGRAVQVILEADLPLRAPLG
ncbi:flagellar assembly protein FliW [Xylanimonas oleitrophica]|uniref:Flagellar assembly protein FliW n=1 Tax=Xylanimonas oleitrophica TaxID=2607479 RepID=A0A2W5X1G4_9MICO|nr:flagellar assembly protein FliW [Xylanimonas oleitrophica]PZR54115.1 flagellar assembly protein FliW [Xylanimonas oleitrophica]